MDSHVASLPDKTGSGFTYKLPPTSFSVQEIRYVSFPKNGGDQLGPNGVTIARWAIDSEAMFLKPSTMAISIKMRSGSVADPDLKLAGSLKACIRKLSIYIGGQLIESISD